MVRKELAIVLDNRQITFLDEIWPTENKQLHHEEEKLKALSSYDEEEQQPFPRQLLENLGDDDDERAGWTELRKWRIQTLLAISPWGIPLASFPQAYEKMYKRKFTVQEYDYDILIQMVYDRRDIFSIQEPDELTEVIFPEYPQDKILHDARFGYNFYHDHVANGSGTLHPLTSAYFTANDDNWDDLISVAWLNRDDDFPNDVVLAGEEYCDLLLPIPEVRLPGTCGVHKAIIIGVGNPQIIYVNIQSPDTQKVVNLSADVKHFFSKSKDPIEMYRVPKEFIYPGFPCLIFIEEDQSWERGLIVGQASRGDRCLVEAVDYGGIRTVSRQHLYLMPRKYFEFAPQAIMISMFGIKPANGEIKWNPRAATRLRGFSYPEYYLDCLFIQPTPREEQSEQKKMNSISEQQQTTKESSSLILSTSQSTLLSGFKGVDEGARAKTNLGGSKSSGNKSINKSLVNLKKRKNPQYEAIIWDRNDEDCFDLCLNDILIKETYAVVDEKKGEQYGALRDELGIAFQRVSRPKNPMIGAFF